MTRLPENPQPGRAAGKAAGWIDTAGVIVGLVPWLIFAGWLLSNNVMLFVSAFLSLFPCGFLSAASGVVARRAPSLVLGAADVLFSLPVLALVWVVTR